LANPDQVPRLREGTDAWNEWRSGHPDLKPDLSNADLHGIRLSKGQYRANLIQSDLHGANLNEADLRSASLNLSVLTGAKLIRADLSDAEFIGAEVRRADLSFSNLAQANLFDADLAFANLEGANPSGADLRSASFFKANLTGTDLCGASLLNACLVNARVQGAVFTGCNIHGVSIWGLEGTPKDQRNLVISASDESVITVDDLEIAQFIYLLLNNQRIKNVIDTITSKIVLILGRFMSERLAILEAIRNELRRRDYVPILFDFDKPHNRDLTETISTLAHMARFIIADITDAKSIPQELSEIVKSLPSVPVRPLLLASQFEYGMFEHFRRYPWMLPVFRYESPEHLLSSLDAEVIGPSEVKAKEQTA